MVRTAVAALAFVALLTGARAEKLTIDTEPGFMTCGKSGCAWGRLPAGEPRIIHVQPTMPQSQESVRVWYEHCHPQLYVDDLGVERYRYSAKGCDLGPR